jgi:hypothetical protein
MQRINRLPRGAVSAGIGLARLVERCLPVDRAVVEFLRQLRPDVVLVSPLVVVGGSGAQETEVLKARMHSELRRSSALPAGIT